MACHGDVDLADLKTKEIEEFEKVIITVVVLVLACTIIIVRNDF